MKQTLLIGLILYSCSVIGQDTNTSLKELLNHVVGGVWVSDNASNEGKPEDYKTFFMRFNNWSDDNSVSGTINGIRNDGDTTRLIEIWNFIDIYNNNLYYVHRTTWGWIGTGTIEPFEEKHVDIQFKTQTPEGEVFYTRDLHYLSGQDKMKAVSYHKSKEEEEWQQASTSEWIRKQLKQ